MLKVGKVELYAAVPPTKKFVGFVVAADDLGEALLRFFHILPFPYMGKFSTSTSAYS